MRVASLRQTPRSLTLLVWIAAGCSSVASQVATESEPPTPLERGVALIAPMNLQRSVPALLEQGFRPTEGAMNAYLKRQGFTLKKLAYAPARRIWDANRRDGYVDTVRATIADLAERIEFDVLVIPAVVPRSETIAGTGVEWDGVYQKIRMPRKDTSYFGKLKVQMDLISLHVEVWDRAGRMLHEGYGGLEVPLWVDLDLEGWGYELKPRDDLYQDPESLFAGIEAAFGSFLGEP